MLSQLEQGKNPHQAQPSQPPPQAKPPQPPPPQAQPTKADTFPAPNLIGMTYEQARELAPGTGLLANISGTVVCRTQAGPMNVCPSTPVKTATMGAPAPYNPHLAGGRVVKQDPGAGTPVRKGYTITVAVERTVSNCIQMPRVIGLNSSHATQTLRNYGFAAVKTQLISTREKSAPVQLQTPREGSWVWPSCTEVSLGL